MPAGKLIRVPRLTKKERRARRRTMRTLKKKLPQPTVHGERAVVAIAGRRSLVTKPVVWPCPKGRLPERILTKMFYAEGNLQLAPASPSGVYYVKLNSIYDPNGSGTGHQPDMHDAFATLFTRYKVHSATLEWRIRNNTNIETRIGIACSDDTITALSRDQIEQRCHVHTLIRGSSMTDGQTAVMKIPIKMRSFIGSKYEDPGFSGAFGADPTDLVYAYLCCATEDAVTNVNVYQSFRIVFNVECTEPILDRSLD